MLAHAHAERRIAMGFLFNQVFWGALLIIIGVTVIIKVLFNIHIPLVRIIFAFLLIYIGIWFLVGGQWRPEWQPRGNTILFNDLTITVSKPSSEEYNVIFSQGTIDFTGVALNKGVTGVKLNTIFSKGILKINPDIPAKIVTNSVFASAKMPDGNEVHFGSDYTYKTKSFKEDQDYLLIKADVVFGALEVVENRPL
jgi:hypothetical protein